MPRSFSGSVDDFVLNSRSKVEAIFKTSAEEVFELAQKPVAEGGRMPIDTGFLRKSLQTGLNGDVAMHKGAEAYRLTIAGWQPGDVLRGGWTAYYAPYVEYGTHGRVGRHFFSVAASQWQTIINRNVARFRRRGAREPAE